ncbi:MAG TPA: hypothetical protein VK085_10250 [Pseudogracilibacillus sp.]|nr:hypothetical protein [Pseudogracilibacillus sp.]
MKKYVNLLLMIFILVLSGCSTLLNLIGGGDEIIFGTGTFEEGIDDEKSPFTQEEDILLEAYTSEAFGTSEIKFTVLSSDNDSEEIYDEWYDKVDPTWDQILYEFHLVDYYGEFEPGDYIVRIFKDESELIAEGKFSIEK